MRRHVFLINCTQITACLYGNQGINLNPGFTYLAKVKCTDNTRATKHVKENIGLTGIGKEQKTTTILKNLLF